MNDHIREIEVNGHKFEVDLRTAKKIDQYRVGDKVKVLIKSYSGYETHPGVIVGIDAFKNLPTIVIAYVANIFSKEGKVSFAYLNSESGDKVEICPMSEDDVVPNRDTVKDYFDKSAADLQSQIDEVLARKEYFLRQYGVSFGAGANEVAEAIADI